MTFPFLIHTFESDHLNTSEEISISLVDYPCLWPYKRFFTSDGGFVVKFTLFEIGNDRDVITMTNGPNEKNIARIVQYSGGLIAKGSYVFHHRVLTITLEGNPRQPDHRFRAEIAGANSTSSRKFYSLFDITRYRYQHLSIIKGYL